MRKHLPSAISSAAIRYALVCGSQAAMFAFAGATAFLLRFDFSIPSNYLRDFVWAVPIWVIVKTLSFQLAKLNRRGWRYVSFVDLYRLVVANSIASIISCGTILLLLPRGFPRSLYALDFTLCVLGTTGLRASIRMIAELTRTPRAAGEKRALIYGAGDAGITLLREIRNNSRLSYHVVGFIDDCAGKQNLRLGEVSIIGQGDQVAKLVTELAIDIILIAHRLAHLLCKAPTLQHRFADRGLPAADEFHPGLLAAEAVGCAHCARHDVELADAMKQPCQECLVRGQLGSRRDELADRGHRNALVPQLGERLGNATQRCLVLHLLHGIGHGGALYHLLAEPRDGGS